MARRTDVSGIYSDIVHRYLYMYTHPFFGKWFSECGRGHMVTHCPGAQEFGTRGTRLEQV